MINELNENSIIDAENYKSNDETLGFKIICLRQLQKVVNNKSKEMKAGFWVMTSNPNMAPQKLRYINDTREELINSIDTLYDLLTPKFDEVMKKDFVNTKKELEDWIEEYKTLIEKGKKIGYWEKTLKIYRKFFVNLCNFLERLGWLEDGGVTEE